MTKGYIKLLWKIEELWQKYYQSTVTPILDISENYKDNTSQYYNRFHQVNKFDFTGSKKPVFADDYGEYKGLEKCQSLKKDGKLIYLFDNHNEMLYPLMEIASVAPNGRPFDVIHIDAHPDDAEFIGIRRDELNLKNIKEYIAETRISDFFDAVFHNNLIGKIHRVCHSDNFEFFLPPEKPYILSLDIDIFGPEGDFAELKDKVRAIALAWNGADTVCIAMSPGFIDQGFAVEIIKIMTKT